MKAFVILIIFIGPFAFLTGCNKTNQPETVAQEWLTAFYNDHYEAAKKHSTDDTKLALSKDTVTFTASGNQVIKHTAGESAGILYALTTVKITSVKQENGVAIVSYTLSNAPGVAMPPIKLVQQKNEWLVQL